MDSLDEHPGLHANLAHEVPVEMPREAFAESSVLAAESAPVIVETQAPSAPETEPPHAVETQTPHAVEAGAPHAMEAEAPSAVETEAPHAAETNVQHPVSTEAVLPRAVDPAAPPSDGEGSTPTPDPAVPDASRPGPAPRTLGIDPAVAERKRRAQESWERAVAAKESNAILDGFVTASVKGGLLVDVDGVRGFLPASQAQPAPGAGLETLVKTKVPLKVIDVDVARKRIVVSHRRAAESQKRAARSTLLRSLAIGQRHAATVVRLAPFGAFVDIGSGIEGLIPMSELAFERVDRVEDVLAVGDTLEVAVLRIDEGGRKIALSRKNALPDPWRDHAAVVRIGATVEGKVVGKEPRLQVEIAPGVVGAVRESDADPADYEIGEAIEVTVRNLDRRTRRITLTTLHGAAASIVTNATSSGFATLGEELRRKG